MKTHDPSERAAPPVSAWHDVQPRARRATPPDEPRPKPMTRNEPRRTSPRTTPATYGFQKGRSDISFTSSREKPEGRGLAGRQDDPAERKAAREDEDGDERDGREVPPRLDRLHRKGDEETHDDDERPEDRRVRAAEETAGGIAAGLPRCAEADEQQGEEDELDADRDEIPHRK